MFMCLCARMCVYACSSRKHSSVPTVQDPDPPQGPPQDSPKQGRSFCRRRWVKHRAFRGGVLALLATMALW